jgi:hypothetical protein
MAFGSSGVPARQSWTVFLAIDTFVRVMLLSLLTNSIFALPQLNFFFPPTQLIASSSTFSCPLPAPPLGDPDSVSGAMNL